MTDTMQDDGLIERLRNRPNDAPMPTERLLDEAADRIAALRAENEALRAAGQALYDAIGSWNPPEHGFLTPALIEAGQQWNSARALLGSKP